MTLRDCTRIVITLAATALALANTGPEVVRAQTTTMTLGPWVDGQPQHTSSIYNVSGGAIHAASGNVYPLPAELTAFGASYTFAFSPSERVLFTIQDREHGGCVHGPHVYFHRVPSTDGSQAALIQDACVDGTLDWTMFFDGGQQIAVVAAPESNNSGNEVFLWFDLVTGAPASRQVLAPQFDNPPRLTFAPSGTAALVRHTVSSVASFAMVNLCPGQVGQLLHEFASQSGVAAAETVAASDSPTGYRALIDFDFPPDHIPDANPELLDCLGGSTPPSATHVLTTVVLTGGGGVTSTPAGIDCPNVSCDAAFAAGSSVTLTAHPDPGYGFDHWSGECSGSSSTTSVVLGADKTCEASFDVVPIDLALSMTAAPEPVVAGRTLTYSAIVRNTSDTASSGATVMGTLPAGVRFESSLSPGCGPAGAGIFCAVDSIPAHASRTVPIGVTVDPSTRGGLTFTATVMGYELDPTPSNDAATASSSVTALVDLSVVLRALPNPVAAGGLIVYQADITNAGPSTATGITTTLQLPSDVTPVSGASPVACAVDPLPPGRTRRMTVLARVNATLQPGAGLMASVQVTGVETDTNPANNSMSTTPTVGPPSPPAGQAFTKIADFSTTIPDGTGTFIEFGLPVFSDGFLAFYGGGGAQDGVYRWSDGLMFTAADRHLSIPSGIHTFTGFGGEALSVDSAGLAFGGFASGIPNEKGIYTTDACTVRMAVNQSTPLPSASAIWANNLSEGRWRHGLLAFIADSFTANGVYAWDGTTVTRVADRDMQVPGAADIFRLGGFGPIANNGDTVVFRGESEHYRPGPFGTRYYDPGIYAWTRPAGTLRRLVDLTTPAPAGGAFTGFGVSLATDGDRVLFLADTTDGTRGIYAYDLVTDSVSTVVDSHTPGPGGAGVFNFFDQISADAGRVAFVGGLDTAAYGIYVTDHGAVRRVLAAGELLDGRQVISLEMDQEALSGDGLAFRARFFPFPQMPMAIYVASGLCPGGCAPPPPAPDAVAPIVSLGAPIDGTRVAGVVPIVAAATDDVGVAGVQFTIDGQALGAEVTAAPFSIQWDTTVLPDGSHLVGAIARDAAGNTASATVTVIVDTHAPVTTAAASPLANASGWNRENVTVDLSAVDGPGGAGVGSLHVTLSGAQTGDLLVSGDRASVTITAEGTTTVRYFAEDRAGNVEGAREMTVRIDKTSPSAYLAFDPAIGQVSAYGRDALSGTSSGPAPFRAAPAQQPGWPAPPIDSLRIYDVVDEAGNTTSLTVRIVTPGGSNQPGPHETQVVITAIQSGESTVTAPHNGMRVQWTTGAGGAIVSLVQMVEAQTSAGQQRLQAHYQSQNGWTAIHITGPGSQNNLIRINGAMLLLRLAVNGGALAPEY